ncbi:NAD-dependent epimerase/dehydratase family protein [Mycolicibacterium farcinogenes]|uniref:NAD-dependent epimerase/dehydratase family protein n=1 Tax=Mycolicibacterium farcinogenes TaxID=1802 RepID=UPI001C8E085F|nr:NAD-dependent epimerase/dehydratase family protein [Mycolicibacterium farcinogenes]QZH60900.1 NAD-dependent epimerase/dehydratase family protein [Mycolicibacterium farcinogenes]
MRGKYCVIGGGSMIGSHLVDSLVEDAEVEKVRVLDALFADDNRENLSAALQSGKVELVEGDVRNRAQLTDLLAGFDGIFNLAAVMSLDGAGKNEWMWTVNADGCFNVLDVARELGVPRVVTSSSAAVYGELPSDELCREDVHLKPSTVYGATKATCEMLCSAFSASQGLSTAVLRYGVVYGPRLHRRAKSSLVISDVIDALLRGDTPEVIGDGSQICDWVFVGDVARANIAAMESDVSGEVFNVGTGKGRAVKEVIDIIYSQLGGGQPPRFSPAPEGVRYNQNIMSADKAAAMIGFRAQTSLEEGIAAQIEFQKAQLAVQS